MKLLKGNLVYSPKLGELTTLEHGALLLDDRGCVRDVLAAAPESCDAETIDYGDALIMPSFVDMHLHAPQYPMLGMGMDLPLIDWLNTYTFQTEARFADTDYARRVYRRLADDLITGGTTRVCMFSSLHTDATLILMEELERAGVTGCVGKVNMDRNSGDTLRETTEESKRETLRWLDECARFTHVKPILTPRFTPSCTDELMEWLGRLGQERGLCVQSHLSENEAEIAWVRELHPDCARYWETYAKYGLWKERTVMAHCVHSDEREREALAQHNIAVAHCAGSNINICSGVAPIRTMLREGIWVTLGSDIAGGALLAMNRVIAMSIRASKFRHMSSGGAEKFLNVDEAYYLGSTAGHRWFGADGGFAKDEPLHAIVVDDGVFTEPVRELTLRERFERSIYLMEKNAIRAVWSEGRRVVG
ncbi:MAG: amidohydrolase family protein [Oscillospiraceae bacterium]|nr:amidohydrolase family protein [Oscillospiraceae bacterium]